MSGAPRALAAALVLVTCLPAQSHDEYLARLRAEPTPAVADEIGARLRGDADAVVALADRLATSAAWPHRRAAARLLGWASDDAVARIGCERHRLCVDPVWAVRAELMLAIGDGGFPLVDLVARAMKDEIVAVRLAAVQAAALTIAPHDAGIPDPRSVLVRALGDAVDDAARDVRLAALTALATRTRADDSRARAVLLRALDRGESPPTLAREIAAVLLDGTGSAGGGSPPPAGRKAGALRRFVSTMPRMRCRPPGPVHPVPFERAVELLESAENRTVIGGELVAVMRGWLARGNPAVSRYILDASETAASRTLCRLALGAPDADGGHDRHLCDAMLDDVLQGRDPVVTAIDELAVRADPADDAALERFVAASHSDGEARRTALRILLARGRDLAGDTVHVLRGASVFLLSTEYAMHRWRRDARARREVVADVERWLSRQQTAPLGFGVLIQLCREPRPELAALLRARLPSATPRLRTSAIDALAALGDARSIAALRAYLAGTDDMASITRIERHLVTRGDESIVDEVLRRAEADEEDWEASSIDDLITLRAVDDDRVTRFVERRLTGRHFDDRTLGHLLGIVAARRGRDAAVAHLRSILERAAGAGEWPGRTRQPISGNVVGHLLESLDAVELVPLALACLDGTRITQAASVLDAVAALGSDGGVAGLEERLIARWRATPDGAADIELRSALLAPLVRCAGDAGLAIVRAEFANGLDALASARRHVDLRAEIVAEAAGVLVRYGGKAGLRDVVDAIVASHDDELITILVWAFSEATDVSTVERELIDLDGANRLAIPPRTLDIWAESAVAHRHSKHPIEFIARRILARPLQRAVASPRAVTAIAARLAGRGGAERRDVARRLVERALRLSALRPSPGAPAFADGPGVSPSPRRLRARLMAFPFHGRAAGPSPRGMRARLTAFGGRRQVGPPVLWIARSDVEFLLDVAPQDVALEAGALALGLGLRSSEIRRARLRAALARARAGALGDGTRETVEDVLAEARRYAVAARVLPAGSPLHARPAFEILEAAALWALDRRDEALAILRRHGWPERRRLPELDEEAFPGLDRYR